MKGVCFLVLLAVCLLNQVSGTHFRYGNIYWRRPAVSGNPRNVVIHLEQAYRFGVISGWVPDPPNGRPTAYYNDPETTIFYDFDGDQNDKETAKTIPVVSRSQPVLTETDWFFGSIDITRTFAQSKIYKVGFVQTEARLSSLENGNGDRDYRVFCKIDLRGNTVASPRSTGVPIVTFFYNFNNIFPIAGVTPGVTNVDWAPSGLVEQNSETSGLIVPFPNGMAFSSTRTALTWNGIDSVGGCTPAGRASGACLFAVQLRFNMVANVDATSVLDFLISVVDPAGYPSPPVLVSTTTNPPFAPTTVSGVIHVTAIRGLSFTMTIRGGHTVAGTRVHVVGNVLPDWLLEVQVACVEGDQAGYSPTDVCSLQLRGTPTVVDSYQILYLTEDVNLKSSPPTLWIIDVIDPTCSDGIQDGDETSVDAGGSCSRDCVVSAWGAYGACSATCGQGTYTRARTVLTPAGGTGAPCPVLSETSNCQVQSCPSCSDGIRNQDETGVDCGGATCPPCGLACCTYRLIAADVACYCGGDCGPCKHLPTCWDSSSDAVENNPITFCSSDDDAHGKLLAGLRVDTDSTSNTDADTESEHGADELNSHYPAITSQKRLFQPGVRSQAPAPVFFDPTAPYQPRATMGENKHNPAAEEGSESKSDEDCAEEDLKPQPAHKVYVPGMRYVYGH